MRTHTENHMKMSDWVLIQTLYECKNLTKAAGQLYLSQPTVTKRLRLVEEELVITIAIRSKRGLQFTPEGEYIAVKAAQLTGIMNEIQNHLEQFRREPSGILRIGASNSMTRSTIPLLLQTFCRKHPHIQFELTTKRSSDIAKLVEQGRLDCGFINGDIPFTGEKRLFRTETAYIASASPPDMETLEQAPYITYQKDRYTQELIEQWWHEYYRSPMPQGLTMQHADLCRELILKGLGYSIFFVRDYMEAHPEFIHPLFHKDGTPLTRNTWFLFQPENADYAPLRAFTAELPFPAAGS